MAPRTTAGAQRRGQAQSDRLYTLGVQGRKTGIILPDSGIRDEHGMEPLDNMFSSPRKDNDDEAYSSDDGPMDIDNTTAPDPATFLRSGPSFPLPIPKGRSPLRLPSKSPAKQNPHLGPMSSPMRGSIIAPPEPEHDRGQSVKRRLDFSLDKRAALNPAGAGLHGKTPQRSAAAAKLTNGHRRSLGGDEDEEDEDEEVLLRGQENIQPADDDDAMNFEFDDDGDYDAGIAAQLNEDDEEEEQEEDQSVIGSARRTAASARKGGAAKGGGKGGRARGAEKDSSATHNASSKRSRTLRTSTGTEHDSDEEDDQERSPKRVRTEPKARGRKAAKPSAAADSDEASEPPSRPGAAKKKTAAKGPGEGKRKSSGVGDTSVVVPRGPPLPKGPGLVISRREVPGDSGIVQTRSGRNSFKPLAYWRNEHVAYDQDQTAEDPFNHKSRFVLPAIKEILRVEEQELDKPKRRGGGGNKKKGGARYRADQYDHEDDEPADEWEEEPGNVVADVAVWQPSYDQQPPDPDEDIEIAEELVAYSSAAVQTREIKDADFRFAKTLNLPFYGCGLVDLPPGAVKKPKNSRKMFMTFFVHTGKVRVTINETSFRISKGGTWFVPRGNYYSIENDYDRDARLFFSQGCEVPSDAQAGPAGKR